MGRPLRVALRFGMPSVVSFHAFRKQSFTAALTATSQRGASAFCLHASAESVLALTRTFRWLISAFHSGKLRALKLGACVRLSTAGAVRRLLPGQPLYGITNTA